MRTKDQKEAIKKYAGMVGKSFTFSGGLFSSKRDEPSEDYKVLDWRWGSAKVMDMKTLKEKHPTVEFLIKKEGMNRSKWTRPFPVPEINL